MKKDLTLKKLEKIKEKASYGYDDYNTSKAYIELYSKLLNNPDIKQYNIGDNYLLKLLMGMAINTGEKDFTVATTHDLHHLSIHTDKGYKFLINIIKKWTNDTYKSYKEWGLVESNQWIKDNKLKNILSISKNSMKEDLTFFKDDEERNANGSRVKNPNRVFAAKKAHRTHGASYKQAYKRGNDMRKNRASMVVEELEKFLESKIEQSNPVNLYAEINSDNTTMGFQIKFDEENLGMVDITAVSQDKEGTGAYQLETGDANKMEASAVFQSLVNDLNDLLSTFDNDFEALLKKNGIVRRVD